MLFDTVKANQPAILKALLDTGQVPIECRNVSDMSLLGYALEYRSSCTMEYLLDREVRRLSYVASAATAGDHKLLKMLIATGKAKVDTRIDYGDTPLIFSSAFGSLECVRQLLTAEDVGVDVIGYDGCTPLCGAARSGFDMIVQEILATGKANMNATDCMEYTPLARAASRGHIPVVEQLLAINTVKSNARNNRGETPIAKAVSSNNFDCAIRLIDTDQVDVGYVDNVGKTLLMKAAADEPLFLKLAGLLMDKLAFEIQHEDRGGRTLLSWVAQDGTAVLVRKVFAANPAAVDVRDYLELTPLCYAVHYGPQDSTNKILAPSPRHLVLRTLMEYRSRIGFLAVAPELSKTISLSGFQVLLSSFPTQWLYH
ncbi:hypothetical protein FSARC_2698 [Fusarium sarcochroum]|uniref:Ankyrin repeat protein n=1 Tax=Fusarium sarcochroum TaxID=1208366 RepID=A0A8H4U5Z4_9HYPO|nr:hypothetical protein FSARC_2698 [Fusarium sarcochroum]